MQTLFWESQMQKRQGVSIFQNIFFISHVQDFASTHFEFVEDVTSV